MKQQKITTTPTGAKISADVILENEKIMNLNEILANEVSQNGIKCKAITDIGSLPIEKKSYYSHLFPMSPRIVTNRGCIRLEGNGPEEILILSRYYKKTNASKKYGILSSLSCLLFEFPVRQVLVFQKFFSLVILFYYRILQQMLFQIMTFLLLV